MATARSHNIPLEGDWRYAARLLSRQATPAGKKHFNKVVGFATPGEKMSLALMFDATKTPKEFLSTHKLMGADPDYLKKLKRSILLGYGHRQREMGLFKLPNRPMRQAFGEGNRIDPKRIPYEENNFFQRSVHTHPLHDPEDFYRPLYSKENLETVLPSGVGGAWTEEGITPIINALKRQLKAKNITTRADLTAINSPVQSTHVILSPELGIQSVYKGSNGLLNKMYFKYDQPIV
jgi:hypothetical protein